MQKLLILWMVVMFSAGESLAQPYFDVAGASFLLKPAGKKEPESCALLFVNLPAKIGNRSRIIPALQYEARRVEYEYSPSVKMHSAMLPVTWYQALSDSGDAFTLTIITRFNSTNFNFGNDSWQPGAAFIYTHRVSAVLKLKGGLYYNREFFSDFFIPLAGIDWNITHDLSLFGVLPNVIRLEKKFKPKLNGGILFRSITNSYMDPHGGYYKVEDNHLGIYADFYFPANITLSAEAGHSAFKRIRDRSMHMYPDLLSDGLLFRATLSYRVKT